jgi:hypothetical protein
MKTRNSKFYLNSNKETSCDSFINAFELEEESEAVNTAKYAGYEVAFDGYWTENGEYFATHVNGVKLERPVKL